MTTVPDVRKAVPWNSPFYGTEGRGWFLTYHDLTRYVKVAFFDGAALEPPLPPVGSKEPDARYVRLQEGEDPDLAQLADWIAQAARIAGWDGF